MSTILKSISYKTIGYYSLFSILIMLYLGGYYYLSKFFIYHINNYIKLHIGNDPLLMRNFYIISIFIKFLIFFLLLKILIRATYNYMFIEDDKDCEMYNISNLFANIISITFFIIYESIMFPLYFIDSLDKIFNFILEDIKKLIDSSNTGRILSSIEKDIHNVVGKDLENLLFLYYDEFDKILNRNSSFLDKILIEIENIFLFFIPEKYKVKEKNDVFVTANKIGSILGSSTIIYLILLFAIFIFIYKKFKTGFWGIVLYIIVIIIFCYLMYQIIVNKLMKFSISSSQQILEDKVLLGNRTEKIIKELDEDALTLIKDVARLNPIVKIFINKLIKTKLNKIKRCRKIKSDCKNIYE